MLQMHLMLPLHFVYKMLESGKMHFGCAKMHFCITFSKGKCSAVQKCIWCKNAVFFALQKTKMRTFCNTKCYKCIWCKNAFLQRNAYILRSKMFSITFSKGKCSAKQNVTNAFDAEHFPKENVQQPCLPPCFL